MKLKFPETNLLFVGSVGVETVLARTNRESGLAEIVIVIESHKFQNHNFFTVNWRELWVVSIDHTAGTANMKGTAKVQVRQLLLEFGLLM